MREDHLEVLDKLYPKGFLIMRVDEDDKVRMSYYNKSKNETLYHALVILLEIINEANEANGEVPPGL